MHRRLLTAAPLAAILLISGCSGPANTDTSEKSHPPASAGDPAPSTSPKGSAAPSLDYPKKVPALVSETSGTGNRKLPAFTPDEEIYTIYADCTGEGSVSLMDRDNPEGEPHAIACDDAPTVGVIHAEAVPQHLAVEVTGGTAQWAIVIVTGDQRSV